MPYLYACLILYAILGTPYSPLCEAKDQVQTVLLKRSHDLCWAYAFALLVPLPVWPSITLSMKATSQDYGSKILFLLAGKEN